MFNNLTQNYPFFQIEILGNTIFDLIAAIVVFFVAIGILKLFQTIIISRLKKFFKNTKTELDDIIINAIDAIYWPFYVFAAIYIAIQFILVPPVLEKWAFNIFLVIVVYYAIKFLAELIDFGTKTIIAKKESDQNAGIIKLLSTVAKTALWLGAIVLALANMGYNVTSLVAGLGIGGIAIALALQNILGDLFSSLAIYFDKPFKPGDFIVVGDHMGTVKQVGIKTTRIQALQGEEIVISNSELTKTKIQNYGLMEKRRIVFNIGATYDTPLEKVKKVPGIIKKAIEKHEKAEVDRVHFKTFGDSALLFETVFYIHSGEYTEWMDIQQAINLDIMEKFAEENIEFAYPTQTLYLKK